MQRLKSLAAALTLLSTQALAQAGGNNDLVISLYNQLEALQSEVQTLRGLVEEQGYQIRRLEGDARDRYMDLDRRLSDLAAGGGSSGAPAAIAGAGVQPQPVPQPVPQSQPAASRPATATPAAPTFQPTAPVAPPLSEQDQYRTALSLLLDQGDAQAAVGEFQRYIDAYPRGSLMANALYWQGEALILLAEYNRAREQFERVLRDFPDHQKASGAMLKLGVAYDQLGNRARAEQLWRELPTRYPGSAEEIGHAQRYLGQPR